MSSGGEIRVYGYSGDEPSRTMAASGCPVIPADNPGVQPVSARDAWGASGCRDTGEQEEVLEGGPEELKLPEVGGQRREPKSGGDSRGEGGRGMFRTALCVEAAMHENDNISSSGLSPGGTLSSPLRATPLPNSPPPRHTGDKSRASAQSSHDGCIVTRRSKVERGEGPTNKVPSRLLVGDMRAMCPAGPLSFYGTTGGGLGLGSIFGGGGGFGSLSGGAEGARNGDDLLKTVVSDSAMRTLASDAAGPVHSASDALRSTAKLAEGKGGDGEKHVYRGGFRHVLPGENWLAGSLRLRQRDSRAGLSLPGAFTAESLVSTPSSKDALFEQCKEDVSSSVVDTMMGVEGAATVVHADASSVRIQPLASDATRACSALLSSPTTATSEVLDLRGKLGVGCYGGGPGSTALPAAATHPLFRLSLGSEVDTVTAFSISGGVCHGGIASRGGGGAENGDRVALGGATDSAIRQPRLVRVTSSSNAWTTNETRGSGREGGDGGVKVQALALLPPALASPDLLASSEDGLVVAVGSHACGFVACYRLSSSGTMAAGRSASDVPKTFAEEDGETQGSRMLTEGGDTSVGAEGLGGCIGRGSLQRRPRRTIPLCTLRLPPGYRAKGLTVVNAEVGTRTARSGGGHSAVKPAGGSGGNGVQRVGTAAAEEAFAGEGLAVLVLAACSVPDADGHSRLRKNTAAASAFPFASHSRGNSSGGVGSPFRTLLLRFLLPPRLAAGDDEERGRMPPPCPSEKAGRADGSDRATGESCGQFFARRGTSQSAPLGTGPVYSDDRESFCVLRQQRRREAPNHGSHMDSDGGGLHCQPGQEKYAGTSSHCVAAGVGAVCSETEHMQEVSCVASSTIGVGLDDGPAPRQRMAAPASLRVETDVGGGDAGAALLQQSCRGLLSPAASQGAAGVANCPLVSASEEGEHKADSFESGCRGNVSVTLDAGSLARKDAPGGGKSVKTAQGDNGVEAVSNAVGAVVGTVGSDDVVAGRGRLEAVLLEALAGTERRMGERLDRIEGVLLGIRDRVQLLERTVANMGGVGEEGSR